MRSFLLLFTLIISLAVTPLFFIPYCSARSSLADSTGQVLIGLTNLSLGTIVALVSLKCLESTTDCVSNNAAKLRQEGADYAHHLRQTYPQISSAEATLWAGMRVLSRTPLTLLLPSFIRAACTFGLGYAALRLLQSGYDSLVG